MKQSASAKKLAKVFNQLLKEHGNPDGFAIDITPDMIEVMKQGNSHINPETNWVIINHNGSVPSLYYVENGMEHIMTIQKYYPDYVIEKLIEIILNK